MGKLIRHLKSYHALVAHYHKYMIGGSVTHKKIKKVRLDKQTKQSKNKKAISLTDLVIAEK